MDLIDKTYDDLVNWMRVNRKAEQSCFWRLYKARSMASTASSKSPLVTSNYQEDGLEESAQLLLETLSTLDYIQFFSVALVSSTSAHISVQRNILNPYYNNGVQGTNNQQPSNQASFRFDMMEKFFSMQMQAQAEAHQKDLKILKEEFKHKKEIEELKNEIGAIKSQSTTLMSTILEQVQPLLPVIAEKILSPPPMQKQAPEPKQESSTPDSKSDNKSELPAYIVQMMPLIEKCLAFYPDFIHVLGELALIGNFDKEKKEQVRLAINKAAVEVQTAQKQNTNE